jgi:disulfide bond formation protein DsbB
MVGALIAQIENWPTERFVIILLAASAATLGGALAFQHIGGLAPCQLCLWQRPPYWLAIAITAATLLAQSFGQLSDQATRIILLGVAAIFAVGAGLGAYHFGVEQKWWDGPASCSIGAGALALTIEQLENALRTAKVIRCDEVPWSFLGISMAGYNVLISLFLCATAIMPWVADRRKKP